MLSKNPHILVSLLNTKLRDYYSSLDLLCEDLDESQEDLLLFLNKEGYYFDKNSNQFKAKE